MYQQKTNHLKTGDLITVQKGWDKHVFYAVYCFSSDVSITYKTLYENSPKHDYLDHIRTRHSPNQRVFKVTLDNLSEDNLKLYKKVRKKVLDLKKKAEKKKL